MHAMGRARSQAIGAKPPVENQSGSRSVAAQSAVGLAGTVRRGAKWGSGLDVFGRGPTTAPETPVGRPASERHCTFFPYGPRLRHRLKALHYLIHNAGRLTTCDGLTARLHRGPSSARTILRPLHRGGGRSALRETKSYLDGNTQSGVLRCKKVPQSMTC